MLRQRTVEIRHGVQMVKTMDWIKRLRLRKSIPDSTAREPPIEGKTRDADGKQLAQNTNDVVISHVDFYQETLKYPNVEYLSDAPRHRRTRTRRR